MPKQWIPIVLALMGALLLAGCSQEEPVPETTATSAPPAEKVSLLVEDAGTSPLGTKVLDAFQERYGFQLEIQLCDPTQYTGRLQLALTGNEPFDLIETTPVLANAYRSRLQDARPLLEADAPEYLSQISVYPLAEDVNHRLSCFPTRIVQRRSDIAWFAHASLNSIPSPEDWSQPFSGKIGLSIPGGTEALMEAITPLFGGTWGLEEQDGRFSYGCTSEAAQQTAQAVSILAIQGVIDPSQAVRTRESWRRLIQAGDIAVTAAPWEEWDLLWQSGYRMVQPPAWSDAAALPAPAVLPQQWCSIPLAASNPEGAARLLEACFSQDGSTLINYGIEGYHSQAAAGEDGTVSYTPLAPYDQAGLWQAKAQGLTPAILPGRITAEEAWLSSQEAAQYTAASPRVLTPVSTLRLWNPASAQRVEILENDLLRERQRFVESLLSGEPYTETQWQEFQANLNAAGLEQYLRYYQTKG